MKIREKLDALAASAPNEKVKAELEKAQHFADVLGIKTTAETAKLDEKQFAEGLQGFEFYELHDYVQDLNRSSALQYPKDIEVYALRDAIIASVHTARLYAK